MGTSHKVLRVVGGIILLGAVAHSAPNPILPKKSALGFFESGRDRSVKESEEHETPELPEDVPVPNCSPSAKLLAVGNWVYVPNSGQSNTADVWFTVLPPMVTYNVAKASCAALDPNMQLASIMNSGENKALKNLHGGGDKSKAKTWTCGYYDQATSKYFWLMVAKT